MSSTYTFIGTTSPSNTTQSVTVASGTVPVGQSGLFLPSEVAALTAQGIALLPGPSQSPVSQLSSPSLAAGSTGSPNGAYKACVTFVTGAGETIAGPEATITVTDEKIDWSDIPVGSSSSGVIARKLYRTVANGASGSEKFVAEISDNTTTAYTDDVADGSLGASLPTSDTSWVQANQISSLSELQSLSTTARNQLIQLIQQLVAGTPSGSFDVTDGTHTVDDVETLTFSGGTVSGSDGDATVTITGGGSVSSPEGTISVTDGTEIDVVYGTEADTAAEGNDSRITGALQTSGGTMSGAIAMGSSKITGLEDGSSAQDAAAFGQIPTALPPNGDAGGVLSGTYPNPGLAASAVAIPDGWTATTQSPGDDSTKVGTTAYADAAVLVETERAEAAEELLVPLSTVTAEGDLIVGSADGEVTRLGIGADGDVLTSNGTTASWQAASGLAQVATTGESGFALENGTPTILSWTAPDDGDLHTVMLVGEMNVTSAVTGGECKLFNNLGGSSTGGGIVIGNSVSGTGIFALMAGSGNAHSNNGVGYPIAVVCDPGSTVTLNQVTAVTAGAATLYAAFLAA